MTPTCTTITWYNYWFAFSHLQAVLSHLQAVLCENKASKRQKLSEARWRNSLKKPHRKPTGRVRHPWKIGQSTARDVCVFLVGRVFVVVISPLKNLRVSKGFLTELVGGIFFRMSKYCRHGDWMNGEIHTKNRFFALCYKLGAALIHPFLSCWLFCLIEINGLKSSENS